jgi:hypothetical protein
MQTNAAGGRFRHSPAELSGLPDVDGHLMVQVVPHILLPEVVLRGAAQLRRAPAGKRLVGAATILAVLSRPICQARAVHPAAVLAVLALCRTGQASRGGNLRSAATALNEVRRSSGRLWVGSRSQVEQWRKGIVVRELRSFARRGCQRGFLRTGVPAAATLERGEPYGERIKCQVQCGYVAPKLG